MEAYLGIDVGTTSIKATVVDDAGGIRASVTVPCRMENPKPGMFEADSSSQWIGGVLKALEALGTDSLDLVRAVCVSSVCASFVPVDGGGHPLRNAILYGIDTRAASQTERLNRGFSRERTASIAGAGFTSHSVLPKILWIKENEPEIYRAAVRFVESSNCVTSFLTGRYAWDRPSAAGGHMIDVERGAYPSGFLKEIGIDEEKLPPLLDPLDELGRVTPEASRTTGIPEGIPVLVGACDVNAEAFACGAFDPGSLLLVYGSTLSTLFTIGEFRTLPGFLTGPSILGGTYRLGGATSSGGRYMDWMRGVLGPEGEAEPEAGTEPTGIVMLPFLDGARIPYQDPECRVLWYGMDSSTTRADLRKAAMESLGCELYDLAGRFSTAMEVPGFAHVTGGLANDSRFLRILANVSGIQLRHFRNVNAAFGDALMAVAAVSGLEAVRGILRGRAADPENVEEITPNSAVFRAYGEKRRRYAALLEAVRGLS